MGTLLKEYDAKTDSKNRITLRDSKYNYYRVSSYSDGTIKLSPMSLVSPKEVVTKEQVLKAVSILRKNAKKNGTTDMTLEEINKIIYEK